jgi:integrase
MKVSLELYRQNKDKNYPHPLVIRFAVNRQTYRYPCEQNLTDGQWTFEQRNGYPNTGDALDKERKAVALLGMIDFKFWNYQEFVESMGKPLVPKDAITNLWIRYDLHRDQKLEQKELAWRTRELDGTVKNKVFAFLVKKPLLNNVHAWGPDELKMFEMFLSNDEGHPISTVKIYMETLRTFFSWCADIEEIIARSPFRKFKIKKAGQNSWFPYSYKDLRVLLALEPINEKEQFGYLWMKRLLYSGGSDPKDFSEMRWRQVHDDFIQMMRVKVSRSSKSGKKLLYLTPDVLGTFEDMIYKRGKPDDLVLDVMSKDLTEKQNIDRHKRFMDKIKEGVRSMLARLDEKLITESKKPSNIHFNIKRLRPTAAVVANAATGDVNYVSKMLIHSNLAQTSVYLSGMPNDEMKLMQIKYEEALRKVMD